MAISKIRVTDNRFECAGKPFVPFGVNYFRPGTGWAPQLWKKFDAEAIRRDFGVLKFFGVNCVRVFLSYGSFHTQPGKLDSEGADKLDKFLEMAEENGIYAHPTGADHWEGLPRWVGNDRFADEHMLVAQEEFWKLLAGRYKGRNVLFAYDLLNEPMIRWKTPTMQRRWNAHAAARYQTREKAAEAWQIAPGAGEDFPIPPPAEKLGDRHLLDFQDCREAVADRWVRRQVAAIKSADADALVTCGYIQWAIPALIANVGHYAAFRPSRQAKDLDFLEFHFYPLDGGVLEYDDPEKERRNLAYLEALAVEMAKPGRPVVLAEFGWYGGGTMPLGNRRSKPAGEQDQERWCTSAVRTTEGLACGWLNWGLYDHPEARDTTVHTGLLTPDGKPKAWGNAFKRLAEYLHNRDIPAAKIGPRPAMPWEKCITSRKAGDEFREEYFKAFSTAR